MYLIVGLGNPGEKYAQTRHNIGFQVVAALAEKFNVKPVKKFSNAVVGEINYNGEKLIIAQPLTFMNLSGNAVSSLLQWYKIGVEKMIVVYDDLDLEPGKMRIRLKGGSGGHNGIKSIIQHVKTENFMRIRLGIGRPPAFIPTADYVLQRFHSTEKDVIERVVQEASQAVLTIVESGIDKAMNSYN